MVIIRPGVLLCVRTSLILTPTLQGGDHSYLHVTKEEGEAQRS